MAAVEAGRTVALANKEALVTAGALMTDAATRTARRCCRSTANITRYSNALPEAAKRKSQDYSDGKRRSVPQLRSSEMRASDPAQAVAHPNWSMGAKISVDSATLMNKGLELIEAHYLFGCRPIGIEIVDPPPVGHPLDGRICRRLGACPAWQPRHAHSDCPCAWPGPSGWRRPAARLDLAAIAPLDFEAPDLDRFPALRLARARAGGGRGGASDPECSQRDRRRRFP